jgi:hypothetical protein
MRLRTKKGQVMARATDGFERRFVCEATSPDGGWNIEVFGPNRHCNFLYAYARHAVHGVFSFGLGREPAVAHQIAFRWDLPNGSWGIFIDGDCWAIYTYRPTLRMRQHRIHSRSGSFGQPFSDEEIRFASAKSRGQQKGTHGFVVEE